MKCKVQNTRILTSEELLTILHKSAVLYSEYVDTTLLFIFREKKSDAYDYYEVRFGKNNFMPGDGFDLQTAVKIYVYEVDASVNQGAVTCRNCVFLYPRDELKRLFAEIIDTFFHRLKGIDLLKHFAGNSQETHRMTSNSMIDERALHEIYLAAFENAVKKANPATVMASYNYVNGVPACISAGMDVEMPDSGGNHFPDIMNAVKTGSLSEEALEAAVKRIEALNMAYRQNIISDKRSKVISEETRKANHGLARQVEEESAVLLKNDAFLPLSGEKEILIVGDLAVTPRIQGGSSSHIHTERVDSLIGRGVRRCCSSTLAERRLARPARKLFWAS